MAEISTEYLFDIELTTESAKSVGPTPAGNRIFAPVAGGRFAGPRLTGRVLPGGSDAIIARPDDTLQLDVRLLLETDDAALIYMTYRGLRHAAPAIAARIAQGQDVDPTTYYFRTAVFFETAAEPYGWLNRIVAVATGARKPQGPVYQVYQVL